VIVCEKRRRTAALQSTACEITGGAYPFREALGVRHVFVSLSLVPHQYIDYSLITSHHSLAKAFGVHFTPKRGCSSMVERQLPKLHTGVRFPSPADCLLIGYSALDVFPFSQANGNAKRRGLNRQRDPSGGALFELLWPKRQSPNPRSSCCKDRVRDRRNNRRHWWLAHSERLRRVRINDVYFHCRSIAHPCNSKISETALLCPAAVEGDFTF
jgi:hypothetical protein